MFDHVGLRLKDLKKSVRFYQAILEPLGYVLASEDSSSAGFGPPNAPTLWLVADAKGGGAHLAFKAPSRAAVDAFHRAGTAAGARDNGPPGVRPDYAPTYYAAFLIDADGNNIEAVHVGGV
ncbi:MAG TPA: VOC family protein [Polyangiaceae bacterium]|jgi:catechol 2,3-dioxygenase-like lactoylglutathione lyase family enzyme|nr:VOC family protein [Polyangiaceae bacterium]